jgi:hypothetical protein
MGRSEWLQLGRFLFRYTKQAKNPFPVDSLMHYWLGLTEPGAEEHFDEGRRARDTAGRPVLVMKDQQFRHFGSKVSGLQV